MNEILFLLHIGIICLLTGTALRRGKQNLILWICLQAICANLFVLKQISLFGLEVTCSDVFAIGGMTSLNLLREYYSPEEAKKASYSCLYAMLSITLLSSLHLLYKPSIHDHTQEAYTLLFAPAPRLFLTSILVLFIVQQVDLRLFTHLKNQYPTRTFAFRNRVCLLTSQGLDTLLFTFIGLSGLMHSLWNIAFFSFLVKVVIIATLSLYTKALYRSFQPKALP